MDGLRKKWMHYSRRKTCGLVDFCYKRGLWTFATKETCESFDLIYLNNFRCNGIIYVLISGVMVLFMHTHFMCNGIIYAYTHIKFACILLQYHIYIIINVIIINGGGEMGQFISLAMILSNELLWNRFF